MLIKSAEFIKSAPGLSFCPDPVYPEYAFVGRSNVGKSSLINMLTDRRSLAKTSGRPGKTRLINYFLINEEWYLVDLPGYGYAAVSKTDRKKWQGMIDEYLKKRKNLMSVFLLVDSRIPPQDSDIDYLNWMGEMQIPFTILFTKTDKLSGPAIDKAVAGVQNELRKNWSELPPSIMTSATSREGREDILSFIESTNRFFNPNLLKFD